MRLLDLVEQDHLIRPAPDRFRQHAAFLVADIAGRRADEAGDGVLLHELAHVDAHHRRLVVEQERGQRLGQLRLADAGGAEEHERADRPVRILQAGAGAANGLGHGLHRLALADDAPGDLVFHAKELVALAFQHLVDRNAGPARHHLRDILLRHRFGVEAVVLLFLDSLELALQARNDSIGEFTSAGEVALALGHFHVAAGLVQLFLQRLDIGDLLLFLLPSGGQGGGFLLQIGQFLFQRHQPVAAGLVGFLLQGLALDLELDDAPVQFVQGFGLGVDLHAQAAGRLVHQVDGLVGQEAVGDVAVGERRGGHDG